MPPKRPKAPPKKKAVPKSDPVVSESDDGSPEKASPSAKRKKVAGAASERPTKRQKKGKQPEEDDDDDDLVSKPATKKREWSQAKTAVKDSADDIFGEVGPPAKSFAVREAGEREEALKEFAHPTDILEHMCRRDQLSDRGDREDLAYYCGRISNWVRPKPRSPFAHLRVRSPNRLPGNRESLKRMKRRAEMRSRWRRG